MKAAKIFLGFNTLVFAVFGLYALIDPAAMLASFDAVMSPGTGIYEMRGIFGGVSLGIAGLCAMGIFRSDMMRPALIFLLTYMSGYLLARIVGLGFEGVPQPKFFVFIGFEAVTAILAFALLRKMKNS